MLFENTYILFVRVKGNAESAIYDRMSLSHLKYIN